MDFKANWIKFETGEYKGMDEKYGNPSPYFRKTFVFCNIGLQK